MSPFVGRGWECARWGDERTADRDVQRILTMSLRCSTPSGRATRSMPFARVAQPRSRAARTLSARTSSGASRRTSGRLRANTWNGREGWHRAPTRTIDPARARQPSRPRGVRSALIHPKRGLFPLTESTPSPRLASARLDVEGPGYRALRPARALRRSRPRSPYRAALPEIPRSRFGR
jgi:hypothetical protein